MPFILILLAAAAVGGVGFGIDQLDKREQEERRARNARADLEALRERIADHEDTHKTLKKLLNKKNEQVRVLAAEIQRLRAELARRAA